MHEIIIYSPTMRKARKVRTTETARDYANRYRKHYEIETRDKKFLVKIPTTEYVVAIIY